MEEPQSLGVTEARLNARPRSVLVDLLLLALSALLLAWSLLVFFPAATSWLWIGAIFVGEWGHFGVLLCLLLAFVGVRRGGGIGIGTTLLATGAAAICLTPVIRGAIIASTLPARCSAAFGDDVRVSRVPLSALDLFRGIRSAPVDVTEHVYAMLGAKKLKLDLYQSKQRTAPQPLIIVVHGGSWKGGGKQQLPRLNRFLASEGYAVAAISYRHAPHWQFPAAVDDLFSAINFLKLHALEFQIDVNRIVLVGRSAGGQIALSAAYVQREPAIRGVVAFYAPSDLVFGYENPSPPGVLDSRKVLEDYLGGAPAGKPAIYAAASPVNFVNAETPPTLLIHGAFDSIVAPAHSQQLADRLQNAGRPNLYLALPWATHGCDANLSGPSGQLSLYAIERFLASVMTEK